MLLRFRYISQKLLETSTLPLLVSSRIFFLRLLLFFQPHPINYTRHSRDNPTNKVNQSQSILKFQFFRKKSTLKEAMDLRFLGFDGPLFHALHNMLDAAEDSDNKSNNAPTKNYVRDAKAMAATPADVKELPNSFVFVIDMPGLKSGDIKVQVEDDNVLIISGERKREEENEDVKYVRMERRIGKFMRKFTLPENADTDKVTAVCQDGVLSVTVEKLPPPQPKKPKTIEVKIA